MNLEKKKKRKKKKEQDLHLLLNHKECLLSAIKYDLKQERKQPAGGSGGPSRRHSGEACG